MNIQDFWNAVLKQNPERLRSFFADSAYINWHCSNERFTVEEYIRANCEYPGTWDGTIKRIEQIGDLMITAVLAQKCTSVYIFGLQVCGANLLLHGTSGIRADSFHVVSFIKLKDDKIISLDEYWGDDGAPPQWRLEKKLGTRIHT